MRRFHSDATVRVALLSVTAAGVGLDFSAASVVVFAGERRLVGDGWQGGLAVRSCTKQRHTHLAHSGPPIVPPALPPALHAYCPAAAELPDEVAHVRQAEDRAHRQGQRQPVNIYFLCAKGTTDDRRWQHLNRSLARVSAVHDGAAAAAGEVAPQGEAGAAAGGSGCCSGDGKEAAAAAVAAQAGLLVEGVHDVEEAGLTPAAAKAGMSAAAAAATAAEEEAGALPVLASASAAVETATAAAAAAAAAAVVDGGHGSPAATAQPEQVPSCSGGAAGRGEGEAAAQPAQPAEPPAPSAGRRQPTRGRREASIGTRLAARAQQQDAARQAAALPAKASAGSSCLLALPAQPTEPVEVRSCSC